MSEYRTNAMLSKLGLLYGSPAKDANEAKQIVSEYARLMAQYSDAELEAAADRVISARKFKSWPTIGECIAALEDHRQAEREKNLPERQIAERYPEWSKAAFAAADKLVDSDMGRQAAREGWVLGLHDFCRVHRKLPSPYQIGAIVEASKVIDRVAAGVGLREPEQSWGHARLTAIEMNASLVRMASTFLQKREALARRVLGEAA